MEELEQFKLDDLPPGAERFTYTLANTTNTHALRRIRISLIPTRYDVLTTACPLS